MRGRLLLLLLAACCAGAAEESSSRRRLFARPTAIGIPVPGVAAAPKPPAQEPVPPKPPAQEPVPPKPPAQEPVPPKPPAQEPVLPKPPAQEPALPPAQEPATSKPPAQEPATAKLPPAQEPAALVTSPPAAEPSSALSGGSCPDAAAILKRHDDERAKNGAPPLAWSPDLAAAAQDWADGCKLQSSGQGYGENQGLGSAWRSCAAAMPLWLGGKGSYQPGGTPPSGALAWTQVVWKGSKEVGCGLSQCPDKGGFVVCFYDPPGNVNGQFDANVGGQGQGGTSPANTAG
ncbi:hypothetical protein D9Q98_004643 [Chlorella vulgaris]|uniref:SCP domain-containing protein n=1 Tax=Chlorella vulgaris TaxID=3077 RepID=A0A9D4TQ31_CHLVU|nr:hypothetical protein D9Q98_004643 [Chlorella vulgaris]